METGLCYQKRNYVVFLSLITKAYDIFSGTFSDLCGFFLPRFLRKLNLTGTSCSFKCMSTVILIKRQYVKAFYGLNISHIFAYIC